jgi:hypothetical protein
MFLAVIALNKAWDAKILVFQERSNSSDHFQVLDLALFGPLERALTDEHEEWQLWQGSRQLNQWEYVNL